MQDNERSRMKPDRSRRAFVLFLPFAAIGGMLATVAAAAVRFLRPATSSGNSQLWIDVAPVAELSGAKPVARRVRAEHVAGWAKSLADHSVYILPGHDNQVLSAVCPHEGCEVSWHDEERLFVCPCHDSTFTANGQRINGPAPRGLDLLPSRVVDGKLQVQNQFFVNSPAERITRG